MGHMVQEKGGQFVNMKAMENMKNNPGSLTQMLINALGLSDDEDDDDSSEADKEQPVDPQLN
jgi:hypothetical protein